MATFDLFSAVKDSDTDSVRQLLTSRRCRSHLNDRNEWGDTVLHLAAEAGNSEVCQMLIAGGASVTVRNNRGETCLHRAAVGGHTDCVTAIVERDSDPEAVNSQNDAGYTALHHAAKHGTIDLIQVLLRSGADRMLENNAGETPYMVAHRYQQYEAERLLLNIEQQHADKAIQEMNTKPKKIIAAYSKALKNAHKPESRVRLVIIGDTKSGKTSLRKTLFGEPFNPEEEPTKCIYAEPSTARIHFRQYREWVMQPTSKADAHRLNLEYNDAIIDYILTEVRKPGVSDEVIDLKKLGLQKQPKNVNFEATPSIIPFLSLSDEVNEEEEEEDSVSKEEGGVVPSIGLSGSYKVKRVLKQHQEEEEEEEEEEEMENGQHDLHENENEPEIEQETEETQDDLEFSSMRGRQGTIVSKIKDNNNNNPDDSLEPKPSPESIPPPAPKSKSKLTVFESTLEMSKLLMEHVPLEVLKRLVMRWPVDGEDSPMDQDPLGRRRLLIHLWDCSGDPIQLSVVPLFFSWRSIYIVTHDIRNALTLPSQSFLLHKLTNLQGSCPTNGEVIDEWLAGVMAQTSHTPLGLSHAQQSHPQLPPLIFATPFGDSDDMRPFSEFFTFEFFKRYRKHMVEPNYIAISNLHENLLSDDYCGHHYLRREVDHLARQMPYVKDMVPVQWVKFEQLLHSLIEQKKVVIQLADLERYIAERCDIIGPLQVEPVLSYFNDLGVIIHFHRHPALSQLLVIKPQWLLNSLSAIFESSTTKWITTEVRQAFNGLLSKGYIRRDVLLLAYRCAHLAPRYWNEVLYFLNYMDLIACHSSLHSTVSIYIPAMVSRSPPAFSFGPTDSDPSTLFFSCESSLFPLSLFNQLVVRCIRCCPYQPVLYHEIVHLRLNHSHHLILRREGTSLRFLVQANTIRFCSNCTEDEQSYDIIDECNHITHIIDNEKDLIPGEHLQTYEVFLSQLPNILLGVTNDMSSLSEICPLVLSFLQKTIDFLLICWYPGLTLQLKAEDGQTIDRKWKQTVLRKGSVPERLAMWFNYK